MVSGQPITQACGRCGKTRIAEGYGSALKPAVEIWWLVQKPLEKNLTISANVLKWGTGALNIDASRIGYASEDDKASATPQGKCTSGGLVTNAGIKKKEFERPAQLGRFPANLVLSGDAPEMLDEQSGTLKSGAGQKNTRRSGGNTYSAPAGANAREFSGDSGGASRFFYCAKISRSERNAGCANALSWENQAQNLVELTAELSRLAKDTSAATMRLLADTSWSTDLFGSESAAQSQKALMFTTSTVTKLITELKTSNSSQSLNTSESILGAIRTIEDSGLSLAESAALLKKSSSTITSEKTALALGASHALLKTLQKIRDCAKPGNIHSTVKPKKLMAYLIRMVTPPNGTVLDPFMGSGSTGIAAKECGFDFIGIERDAEYHEIASKRIESAVSAGDL